jgi:hypothetical protein
MKGYVAEMGGFLGGGGLVKLMDERKGKKH